LRMGYSSKKKKIESGLCRARSNFFQLTLGIKVAFFFTLVA
jgi:hypothetical protein